MKVYIKIFLLVICTFTGIISFSQSDKIIDTLSNNILFQKEMKGGIIVHDRGFGLKFQIAKTINAFKKQFFEIEAVTMQALKQEKIINIYYYNAKPYYFGKLNNLYIFRGGLGIEKLLNSKPYWGGVELLYNYSGGASIGLAVPIYLNIINYNSYSYNYSIETKRYDPEIHPQELIYGRGPLFKGIGELSFHPGLYGKAGLNFEFGNYNTKISSLEIGAIIDVYPGGIALMAFESKSYAFLTLFFSVSFGKKYN
ncbi:MAG: hypothetical protein JEY97_11900 [Bacteroidales bacterium]|nr:hypothetical protein [Bacteroidales bacterium]